MIQVGDKTLGFFLDSAKIQAPTNEDLHRMQQEYQKLPRSSFLEIFRFYKKNYRREIVSALSLLFFASLFEGIGIGSLLPLLTVGTEGSMQADTGLEKLFLGAFEMLGLEESIGALLIVIVVFISLKATFQMGSAVILANSASVIARDFRLRVLKALLKTNWQHFISQPIGIKINSVATESKRAASTYLSLCTLISAVISGMIYLTMATMISWPITVAGLLTGLVASFCLRFLVRWARTAGGAQTRLYKSVLARLSDGLAGLKLLRSIGHEARLLDMLKHDIESMRHAERSQVISKKALNVVLEPIIVFLVAIGLYVAFSQGNHDISALLVLAFLFHRLVNATGIIQQMYQSISIVETAFSSLSKLEKDALKHQEKHEGQLDIDLCKHLRFENVSLSFGNKNVLVNASMTIPRKELVAIVGPSGIGKTTTLDLITGLYQPDQGEVYIDNTPLSKIHLSKWRSKIGYVPQETNLFHDTIANNISLYRPEIKKTDIISALKAVDAYEFVQDLPDGIDTIVGEQGSRLSGGQRQRIAIARAIVSKPQLILFDEPTSALDPKTEKSILATMKSLTKAMTVVCVSHTPGILNVADTIFRMQAGRVEKSTSPS